MAHPLVALVAATPAAVARCDDALAPLAAEGHDVAAVVARLLSERAASLEHPASRNALPTLSSTIAHTLMIDLGLVVEPEAFEGYRQALDTVMARLMADYGAVLAAPIEERGLAELLATPRAA